MINELTGLEDVPAMWRKALELHDLLTSEWVLDDLGGAEAA